MNWKQLWFNPPSVKQLEHPAHLNPQLMRRVAMAELESAKLWQELNEVKEKLMKIEHFISESKCVEPIVGVKV